MTAQVRRRTKIRRLVSFGGDYFWQPEKGLSRLGFETRRLTGAMPEIIAEAERLNAGCDSALKARQAAVIGSIDKPRQTATLHRIGPRSERIEQDRNAPSSIYFVQVGDDGPVKIGFARNVMSRLREMQVDNAFQLRLLASVTWGQQWEQVFHERFARELYT